MYNYLHPTHNIIYMLYRTAGHIYARTTAQTGHSQHIYKSLFDGSIQETHTMLKALKKFLHKISSQEEKSTVIWLLETPYRNY